MQPIWVKLPLKRKIHQESDRGKSESWTKEIEVDVRPLLVPLLEKLGHADATEKLLARAFSGPPILRARCSRVDEDGVPPAEIPCQERIEHEVRKDGRVVGFLCAGHGEKFAARDTDAVLADVVAGPAIKVFHEPKPRLLKPTVPPPFVPDELTTISSSSQSPSDRGPKEDDEEGP